MSIGVNAESFSSPAERIRAVLDHLGVKCAHFASALAGEIEPWLSDGASRLASLTLVNPNRLDVGRLATLDARLALLGGTDGLPASVLDAAASQLDAARIERLDGYYAAAWSDVVAEHSGRIVDLLETQARLWASDADATGPAKQTGAVAGVRFRVEGSGPPLVLLPLLLAPSQWEPIVERLSESFSVIVLRGRHLGMVAMLESRGAESGYRRAVRAVFDELKPQPGESILEVGCGTGVLTRYIGALTEGANPIIGADLNEYFLSEARAIAEDDGLSDRLDFQVGNAEALAFEDNCFDVVFSSTVMEECDAEKMLDELIRVTRPGGRIGVIVRGTDMAGVIGLPLSDGLKQKIETPYRSVGENGCADATLYQRFADHGLTQCEFFPHFLSLRDSLGAAWAYREPFFLSLFTPEVSAEWERAKRQANESGTFVFASGLHCAVGIKPA
ncbi:MAG: methyltransferase domain-containing protein [Pseudomonadota bacterium]